MELLDNKIVYIYTLGCKVNQFESDAMLETLISEGCTKYNPEDSKKTPDICIVNTCSVTNMADKKSRQIIHRMRKLYPNAIVVATGCYVQSSSNELSLDGTADLIIGNNRKKDIVRLLKDYISGADITDNLIDVNKDPEFEDLKVNIPESQTRAYLKIQDGCNNFCTFCIIPYVRGRIKSKSALRVIDEARVLAENGVKEIVLTGIDLSSYNDSGNDLADIACAISEIKGIKRVRISSLEPRKINKTFLDKISSKPEICPHFHLSLQSACNATLKRMNRKYTIEEYKDACSLIRAYYDRPALTTDVIVGFPGETDDEFDETVKNLEEINLYEMHIFKYSRRKGTVADRMPDQVDERIKNKRSDILLNMSERHKKAYEESFIGETVYVLVEEIIENENGVFLRGHTDRYLSVDIPYEDLKKDTACDAPSTYINRIIPYSF